VFGLVVMVAGGVLLLDRLNWGFRLNVPIWPVILLFLGLARISERRASGRVGLNRSSAWLIFLAGWGFINEYRLWGFTYETSWPLLIVGAGVMIVWRSVTPMAEQARER
jgi:hypothetical protein